MHEQWYTHLKPYKQFFSKSPYLNLVLLCNSTKKQNIWDNTEQITNVLRKGTFYLHHWNSPVRTIYTMFIWKDKIPFKYKICINTKQWSHYISVVISIANNFFFNLMARYFHWNTVLALRQDMAGTKNFLFMLFRAEPGLCPILKCIASAFTTMVRSPAQLPTRSVPLSPVVFSLMSSVSHTLVQLFTVDIFQFYSKNTNTHTDQTEMAPNLKM